MPEFIIVPFPLVRTGGGTRKNPSRPAACLYQLPRVVPGTGGCFLQGDAWQPATAENALIIRILVESQVVIQNRPRSIDRMIAAGSGLRGFGFKRKTMNRGAGMPIRDFVRSYFKKVLWPNLGVGRQT